MTDPKPATPATDEQVKAWIELGADGRLFIPAHVIDSLVARISADAETIKAKDEEIERLKGDLQEAKHFSSMLTAALENRNEELKDLANRLKHRCFRYHIEDGVQLAKELAQVETLREALEIARKIIYTKTWDTDQHALDAMAAALAATEPKG